VRWLENENTFSRALVKKWTIVQAARLKNQISHQVSDVYLSSFYSQSFLKLTKNLYLDKTPGKFLEAIEPTVFENGFGGINTCSGVSMRRLTITTRIFILSRINPLKLYPRLKIRKKTINVTRAANYLISNVNIFDEAHYQTTEITSTYTWSRYEKLYQAY